MRATVLSLLVVGAAACGPPIKNTPVEEIPKLTKLADATLTWKPRPEVAMFLRYEFFDQFATPERSFFRNRVMLGVSAIFPATAAATVPQRPGTRVDRSDMSIPEPHSPPSDK